MSAPAVPVYCSSKGILVLSAKIGCFICPNESGSVHHNFYGQKSDIFSNFEV